MLCRPSTYQGHELEGTIGARADSCFNSEGHSTAFGWVDVCAHAGPEGLLGIGQRWVRLALVR
jgi:hypothetical protein